MSANNLIFSSYLDPFQKDSDKTGSEDGRKGMKLQEKLRFLANVI